MRSIIILLLSMALTMVIIIGWDNLDTSLLIKTNKPAESEPFNVSYLKTGKCQNITTQAKSFIQAEYYNSQYLFFIDMNIESGKPRFFIYDLKMDSIINSGLVTHGRCNQRWLTGRKYGNKVGCGCTSLGKYKIGASYNGRFGLAYKLYGLDSTNNNAFERFVVLHSHECVPEEEVYPQEICQSDGCPTVSPAFLKVLAGYIDKSKKPILLVISE